MKKVGSKRVTLGIMMGLLMVGVAGCQNSAKMEKDETDYQGQYRNENGDEALEDSAVEVTKDNDIVVGEISNSDVISPETTDRLENIEKIIDDYFYFEEDEQAKQDGIIRGYIDSLGDPYSVYYTAEEYAGYKNFREGEFAGVGVPIIFYQDVNTNEIIVMKVYDYAKEAGIKAQDVLMKVDGEDITSQNMDTIEAKLRGEEGTELTLTIYRSSDGMEHDFTMQRQKVEIPTVEYKMLENHIGYVQVSGFFEVTGWEYIRAIQDLNSQGMEGLIVDLRDNGGGSIDIAVMMLDYMLPEGIICYTEDKDGNVIRTYYSTDVYQFDKPLVVLVNGDSASASEIFAGAIKDYGIGTIIGETTYGKGIGQRIFPFADGSALKLTAFQFFTPNGNDIHSVGIEPDVEVKLDAEAYRESAGENDNQLQAAIDNILTLHLSY